MAILKSVVNVNNGNTGWTRANVMDALETVFANLGWNGGTPINGSPVAFNAPGNTVYTFNNSGWEYCGGSAVSGVSTTTRYFYVTNVDNQAYSILEQWLPTNVNTTLENITIGRHNLETGDAVVWGPGVTNTSNNITGLTLDTTYYVIKVSSTVIRLATTLEDATNGVAVDLTGLTGSWNTVFLRRAYDVAYNNYQIDTYMGDRLVFTINDTQSGGNFFLIDNAENGYNSTRVLNTNNFQTTSYKIFPTGQGTEQVDWTTRDWPQTEDEIWSPQEVPGTGYEGKFSYGYANSTVSTMKGVINILANVESYYSTNSINQPYWKYTVPATETKSSFKIRVYRGTGWFRTKGKIAGITIHSVGEGWSEGDTFTIPGSAVGGVDGTNDILVGTNSATSAQISNSTGVCSLRVTNYGAGSTMYQKHPQGHYGILKTVNASNKTFGTTYHGIGIADSSNLTLFAGCSWLSLNRDGTNSPSSSGTSSYGIFGGDEGLDHQRSYNYIINYSDGSFSRIQYASTSTPTAYPLSIRVYKAQSPQDTNFAIIQFTQTINNNIIPYGTFTIHKGSSYGSNVWDLNHTWLGSYSEYSTGSRSISTTYRPIGIVVNSSSTGTSFEPANTNSLTRECNYGYIRDSFTSQSFFPVNTYECNIDTNNSSSIIRTYYRNNSYDAVSNSSTAYENYKDRRNEVASQANYYKPIKGLPISTNLMPCPYYIPDDFIMLQVSTTPGLTTFRPGDTVEVSPSEVYEVILAGYQTSQNGLDNISENSSMGMLFCGRIV